MDSVSGRKVTAQIRVSLREVISNSARGQNKGRKRKCSERETHTEETHEGLKKRVCHMVIIISSNIIKAQRLGRSSMRI